MKRQSIGEHEWEGFQHFHDPTDQNYIELPEINRLKTTSHKQQHRLHAFQPKINKTANKSIYPIRKKTEQKSEFFIQNSMEKQKIVKSNVIPNKTIDDKIVPEVKKVQPKRYQRIPLIRFEEEYHYSGKIVYKNFIPKTSDHYMRILKEVDWSNPQEKKRSIRNLHGIQFNSQFQGGNLSAAIQVQQCQYDLYMRVDSNTKGHRQWFYFSMQNEEKCKVQLHIYRFKKLYSLFQRGMRPYIKSRKSGNDWKPGGQSIFYHYQNKGNSIKKEKKSFILSFSYNFQYEKDEVFIAAGVPYTYSFLQKQLISYKNTIQNHSKLDMDISVLVKSMCGLDVQLLTIEHKLSKVIHKEKKKRIIVINTRTHSGETSSSWVLDGLLMEISQSLSIQQWLLAQNVILKIIPMLNPDGVFIGNYRTGIIGEDFNRKFNMGKKQYYPQISALKKLVSYSKKQGQVQLFLDLHGHSILKNIFIYGPSFNQFSNSTLRHLPQSLFQNSKYFRLASCKFKAENENIETARVFFQFNEQILSFTCQNSLGLYYHQYRTQQMMAKDWQQFGKTLINSIKDLFYKDITIQMASQKKKANKSFSNRNQLKAVQTKGDSIINKIKYKIKPANKSQKGGIKLFSDQKSIVSHKFDKIKIINDNHQRQNTILEDKIQENLTQSQNTQKMKINQQSAEINKKKPINYRRKSEIIKKEQSSLIKKIMNRQFKKQHQQRQLTHHNVTQNQSQIQQNVFGRSSTFDQPYILQNQINNMMKTQEQEQMQEYKLEVINENFSDQYCSINDSDSQGDNLPDQEKKYIFQYIKSNKNRGYNFIQEQEGKKHEHLSKSKQTYVKESKISKFRQIRFKSIEELFEKEADQLKEINKSIKKVKLQPHKFKDNTSKSLAYKYNEILSNNSQFQDPNLLTISHQKKLYQRGVSKRKDPFVLIQKKGKIHQLFEKQQKH